MKKHLFFVILILTAFDSFGQGRKVYLNSKGNFMTDAKHATSYVLINKLSDTNYFARKFNLRDTMFLKGFYRDSLLTVAHGRFTYYYKETIDEKFKGVFHTDTNSFVAAVGFFSNGLKTGTWTEFEKRGVKRCTYNCKNGKQDGLYQRFDEYHNEYIKEEGAFINGFKDGEWRLYGYDTVGTPVITRTFNKGKKTAEVVHITAARIAPDLGNYFVKKMKKLDTLSKEIEAEVVIGTHGEIKSLTLVTSLPEQTRTIVLDVLNNMPAFIPQMRDGKPEEMKYTFFISRAQMFNRPNGSYIFLLLKKVGNGMEFVFRDPKLNYEE